MFAPFAGLCSRLYPGDGTIRLKEVLRAGVVALVGLLHQGACFVDGALSVVIGLDGEAVLVDGALALTCDVEDLAEVDVAPDLDPLGAAVAAEGGAAAVGGGPGVLLCE